MSTFLFDEIIFGPVFSRRLGVSLGINLLPTDSKLCNFNCIYCECGWTKDNQKFDSGFYSAEHIKESLRKKLLQMKSDNEALDVITFAGNGEPTLHPNFNKVIDDTIELKNEIFPDVKISVLSNATMLHKEKVVEALLKIDNNILKLDSGIEESINTINQPVGRFSIDKLISTLKSFKGNLIIQTLFVKGKYENKYIDNTTDEELEQWIKLITEINPKQVMIYTIARDTPAEELEKISKEKLDEISERVKKLGINTSVSY